MLKKENFMDVSKLEAELFVLLKGFDIPLYRKTNKTVHNYRWLLRNISFRNSDNKNLGRVVELLTVLSKEKK